MRGEADGQADPGWERGWCVGSEEFRQELLSQMQGRIGTNHFVPERKASAEQWGRRIVAERLLGLGLTAEQMKRLAANAPVKVEMARQLRRETTLSLKWIAEQLRVGSWKCLSNLVGQEAAKPAEPELGL